MRTALMKLSLFCVSLTIGALAGAAEPAPTSVVVPAPPTPAAAPAAPASALPAMSFYGSIANDELFDLIKKSLPRCGFSSYAWRPS